MEKDTLATTTVVPVHSEHWIRLEDGRELCIYYGAKDRSVRVTLWSAGGVAVESRELGLKPPAAA